MGNGIARFDGFEFYKVAYPDSLSGRYPITNLKDKSGKLWFGCSDGSVFFLSDRKLVKVPLSNTKSISDIIEGPGGMIYVIPQGKSIFAINSSDPGETFQYSLSVDPVMFSGCFNRSGDLLIGTQENLLICRIAKDSVKIITIVEGFDYSNVTAIHPTDDPSKFLIGTEGNGLFRLSFTAGGNSLERFADHPDWESLSIQSIMTDRE